MNVARDFFGGPFDRELLVVNEIAQIVRVPLPRHWRMDVRKPEIASYRLEGDEMRFVSRAVASETMRRTAPSPARNLGTNSAPISEESNSFTGSRW